MTTKTTLKSQSAFFKYNCADIPGTQIQETVCMSSQLLDSAEKGLGCLSHALRILWNTETSPKFRD